MSPPSSPFVQTSRNATFITGMALALLLAQGCASGTHENRTDAPSAGTPTIDSTMLSTVEGPVVRPGTANQVLAAARALGGEATIVNVWATWCPPCREEFPDLVRFERDYHSRGVRLVFVSTDFEDQLPMVRRFLARQGVDEPSWIKSGDDMEFIDGMHPEWTGALPATFIYDGSGRLRAFWEGAADYRKFELEVGKVLNQNLKS